MATEAVQLSDPMKQRFAAQRMQVNQRANSARQQSQDALSRRFASLGGLNSGAAIKAQERADSEANKMKEQGMAEVGAQEAQAADVQAGREFQSGEAEKQRGFQAKQSDIDRAFQNKVFDFDKESKLKQLDLQAQDLALRRDESAFNKRLAGFQAGQSGGLFGGGGFLGLGIGNSRVDI